jgi:preprotein translocase subunit SecA
MRAELEISDDLSDAEKEKKQQQIKAEIKEAAEKVREAGGLYVIGTERHESRRIDNQLRGRSGRQGDPGATIFFLSLEDDLMRIFGAEKMAPLLANRKIGLKDGEALSHPLISKTLEKAQSKVEQQNFEIRKNLLRFDNVMNDQRKVVYEQRRDVMDASEIEDLAEEMRLDVIEDMIMRTMPDGSYADQWDLESLEHEVKHTLNIEPDVKEWASREGIANTEMYELLLKAHKDFMKKKEDRYSKDVWRRVEKSVLLQRIDHHWKDHLLTMDHMRQGITLRALGQRDPLNEYKTEAFAMFQTMLSDIRESTVRTLSTIEIDPEHGTLTFDLHEAPEPSELHEGRTDPALAAAQQKMQSMTGASQADMDHNHPKQAPTQNPEFDPNDPETWAKTPRNALCPCGSGKKFKHCHGRISMMGEAV